MPRKGVRNITLYFPPGLEWIEDVIKNVVLDAAKKGIKISMSDVVCNALSQIFADSPFREQTKEIPIAKKPGVEKFKVSFSGDNLWLYLFIENLVQTKRLVGIKTSMSSELIRLASNSLKNETVGAAIDIEILKDYYESKLKDYIPEEKGAKKRGRIRRVRRKI